MNGRSEPGVVAASLVVCSRNRPTLLEETVESVLAGTCLPEEIVIIDQSDAPHPLLGSAVERLPCAIRYHWKAAAGVSKARNAAVAASGHELLAFIDDDVLVARDWFGVLIRALNAAGPGTIISGQIRAAAAELAGGFSPSTITEEQGSTYCGRVNKDVLYTGNMAMYREPLRQLGGFDERLGPGTRFPGAEDNDLSFRLLEAGYQIIYVPEAVVYHRAWRNEYLSLRWSYGRGQGGFYAKHMGTHDRYALKRLQSDMRRYLLRCCYRIRSEPRKALGDAIYVIGLLFGASEWLLRERRAH
jgi:GT2 family glycosyltransferase